MAEDFLIRVGVDYSAAVRDTRRFQKEIESILARTASAQGRTATAQVAAQSQAVGANYSRELSGIQRSLDTLVVQSARQQDRLFAILSSSGRNQPIVQVVQPRVQPSPVPRAAPPTPVGAAVPPTAIGPGDRALRRQQAAIERGAVIAETRNVQAAAFAAREQKLQNEILRARAVELQGIQQRIAENAVSQPALPPGPRPTPSRQIAPTPIIPQAPAAPMVVPRAPKPLPPAPIARALPAPQNRPITDFSVQLAAIQRQFLANQQQLAQAQSQGSSRAIRARPAGFFDVNPLPPRVGSPQFTGYPSRLSTPDLSWQQRLDRQLGRSQTYKANLPRIESLINTAEIRQSFDAPMRNLLKGLFNFFPQALPNVDQITARASKYSGTYDDSTKVINIDPRPVHGAKTTVESSLSGGFRTVQSHATKDIFGTAVHEFGHAVDSLRRGGARSEKTLSSFLNRPAFADSVRGSISKYATTNPSELFAESFASVLRGTGSPMAFRAVQDNLGPQDKDLLARRRKALDDLIHRQRVEVSSPKVFDWAEMPSLAAARPSVHRGPNTRVYGGGGDQGGFLNLEGIREGISNLRNTLTGLGRVFGRSDRPPSFHWEERPISPATSRTPPAFSGIAPSSPLFGVSDEDLARRLLASGPPKPFKVPGVFAPDAVTSPSRASTASTGQMHGLKFARIIDTTGELASSKDLVLARNQYVAEYRKAAKLLRAQSELEARGTLPSGRKAIPVSAGRHPGDYSFAEWSRRPDVYHHATMVKGFDLGDATHFGTLGQAKSLDRQRYRSKYIDDERRSLYLDGFDVVDPRINRRRISSGSLDPSGVYTDQVANDAHLLLASLNDSPVRRSVQDSVSSFAKEVSEAIESWRDDADDLMAEYLESGRGRPDALYSLQSGRGISYTNEGEGNGEESIVVPQGAVGSSYFTDVLASPNRSESIKELIRSALRGDEQYHPYVETSSGGVLTDRGLLQDGRIREMLGLASSKDLVLARNEYGEAYTQAAKRLRGQSHLEARRTFPSPLALPTSRERVIGYSHLAGRDIRQGEVDDLVARNAARKLERRERARAALEAAKERKALQPSQLEQVVDLRSPSSSFAPSFGFPGAMSSKRFSGGPWDRGVYWSPHASGATGGAGGLPPIPPRGAVGSDGDDDEIRRQKQQYLNYLRQLTSQARRALIAGEDTTPHLSRLKRLIDAAEAHAEGNAQKYRQNVMAVIPQGSERAGYMLSKTPFDRGGFEQQVARDAAQQRRALSAPSDPIAIGGATWNRVERNLRSWRGAVQELTPPGKMRTKYLLGADPFNLGSLSNNVEHPKRMANEEARAAVKQERRRRDLERTPLTAASFKGELRAGARGPFGSIDQQMGTAENILNVNPDQALASIDQVLARIKVLRSEVNTPTRLSVVAGSDDRVKASHIDANRVLDEAEERARIIRDKARLRVGSGSEPVDTGPRRYLPAIREPQANTGSGSGGRGAGSGGPGAGSGGPGGAGSGSLPFTSLKDLQGYMAQLKAIKAAISNLKDIDINTKGAQAKIRALMKEILELSSKAQAINLDPKDKNYQKAREVAESLIRQGRIIGDDVFRTGFDFESRRAQAHRNSAWAPYEDAANRQTRETHERMRGTRSYESWTSRNQSGPQGPVITPPVDRRSHSRHFWDWMWGAHPDSGIPGETGAGFGGNGGGGGRRPGPFRSSDPSGGWFGRVRRNLRKDEGLGGFFGTGALSALRYGLPSMALYGAMSGISESVREAEEFQFTMEKVKAQLEDTFGAGADPIFQSFKGHILDLAKETGVQADVLADVGMQYQGAFGKRTLGGLSGQELVKSQLDAAAKLGQVTHIPVSELNDGLTAASFGFNRTNEDISNVALRLESLSGVTAKETIGFIGDVAPVAKEAGFELEEFASLAAIAQQRSGRSGTALAESFGRIIPAISQSKDQLLQLAAADDSLRTPEFIQAVNDGNIKGVLLSLVSSFGDLNKESQDFIVNLLGGRREAQVLLSAIGEKGQLAEYTAGAKDSEGTLQSRFESAQRTLTNQMARLRQEFNLFVATLIEAGLGDVFSGLIATVGLFVKGLEGILKVSGAINDFFGGLPGKILGVTASLIAMRAAAEFLMGKGRLALGIRGGGSILENLAGRAGRRVGAARNIGSAATGLAVWNAGFDVPMTETGAGNGGRFAAARAAYSGSGSGRIGSSMAGARALMAGAGPFLAIAGIIGAYTFIKTGIDKQNAELDRLLTFANDTNNSIEDLKEKAKKLRSRSGSGISLGARFSSFFTGEQFLSDSDFLESRIPVRRLSDTQKAANTALLGEDDDVGRRLVTTIYGIGPEKKKLEKLRDELRGATTEGSLSRAFGETLGFGDKFNQTLGKSGVQSLTDNKDAENLISVVSKEIGVSKDKLSNRVIQALAGEDPAAELQNIIDNEDKKYKKETVEQAIALQRTLTNKNKSANASSLVGEANFASSNQTLDTIRKNYSAGVISFGTFIEALSRNVDNQTEIIRTIRKDGGRPTDQTLQIYAASVRELNQTISQQAAKETDIYIQDYDITSGGSELERTRTRIREYSRLIKSGKLSGEDRRKVTGELIEAQKQELIKLAEAAKSGEEAARILNQGVDLDADTRVSRVIGAISEINGNWEIFTQTFNQFSGESAGEYFGKLIRGLDSGQVSPDQVRKSLENKLAYYQGVYQLMAENGVVDPQVKSVIDTLIKTLDQFNHTGMLPGDAESARLEKEIAYQTSSGINDLQSRLRIAKAGGNELVAAYDGLATARMNLIEAEKVGGKTETEAQIRVLEAETQLKKVLADRKKSLMAVSKARANFNKDSVGAAQADLAQAQIDRVTAAETDGVDSDAYRQAHASQIEAEAAIRDTQNARIKAFANLAKIQGNQGSVEQAQADLNLANLDLRLAVGDERTDAFAKVIEAERALDRAVKARRDNLIDLFQMAGGDDPVWQAEGDIQQFFTQLNEAQTLDERIEAQKSLISAQKALRDAMAEVRNSQYELRQAELEAIDDEVGAANVAAQLARAQLSDALKLASEGKSPGDAEINRLRAAVVRADRSAADTAFNEKKDDLEWLYQMGTLTKQEYIGYLEGLKSTVLPGTKQFKELELAIKGLKDDVGAGLQMNLPTSLALPTLYEVRRLDQSVNSNGSAAGYIDNRQQNITINLNNGTTQADLINALNSALGVNTTSQGSTRLY